MVFHVLNRGVGRMRLFGKQADYAAFERVLEEVFALLGMRICAYCVMPNHWHLVLWPRKDGDLGRFMQRLTITHARRWQEHRHVVGTGHVYQGRYKSFPVQNDGHFLTVCRYVERNALRGGLVEAAESWRWSSLWRREAGDAETGSLLSAWPVPRPRGWIKRVNQVETAAKLEALRQSVARGRPFGGPEWTDRVVRKLGLENTLRSRGRPRSKGSDE